MVESKEGLSIGGRDIVRNGLTMGEVMVVSLKISHVHHAALCEILRLALDNAMRHGRVNSFDAECTLVRASQRDCGYLRAVIEEHLPA